jgi:hypothetical protein
VKASTADVTHAADLQTTLTRPRAYTQRNNATTYQLICLSFCLCKQHTQTQHNRAFDQPDSSSIHHSVALTPTALHIPCKILNPGLLAVAEQSAAHHGVLVNDQEAKACSICIPISAYRRLGCFIRHCHLRGPPARILVTAEQRAKSRRGPRITVDKHRRKIRSVAATRAGRVWQCWCGSNRTEP